MSKRTFNLAWPLVALVVAMLTYGALWAAVGGSVNVVKETGSVPPRQLGKNPAKGRRLTIPPTASGTDTAVMAPEWVDDIPTGTPGQVPTIRTVTVSTTTTGTATATAVGTAYQAETLPPDPLGTFFLQGCTQSWCAGVRAALRWGELDDVNTGDAYTATGTCSSGSDALLATAWDVGSERRNLWPGGEWVAKLRAKVNANGAAIRIEVLEGDTAWFNWTTDAFSNTDFATIEKAHTQAERVTAGTSAWIQFKLYATCSTSTTVSVEFPASGAVGSRIESPLQKDALTIADIPLLQTRLDSKESLLPAGQPGQAVCYTGTGTSTSTSKGPCDVVSGTGSLTGTTNYLPKKTAGGWGDSQVVENGGALTVTGENFAVTKDGLPTAAITNASDSYYYPMIQFYRQRGTIASPTDVVAGNILGVFNWSGRVNGGGVSGATLVGYAESLNGNYIVGKLCANLSDGSNGGSNFSAWCSYPDRLQLGTMINWGSSTLGTRAYLYDDGTWVTGFGAYSGDTMRLFGNANDKTITFGYQTRAGTFTEGMRLNNGALTLAGNATISGLPGKAAGYVVVTDADGRLSAVAPTTINPSRVEFDCMSASATYTSTSFTLGQTDSSIMITSSAITPASGTNSYRITVNVTGYAGSGGVEDPSFYVEALTPSQSSNVSVGALFGQISVPANKSGNFSRSVIAWDSHWTSATTFRLKIGTGGSGFTVGSSILCQGNLTIEQLHTP